MKVNGEKITLPENRTLSSFLIEQGYDIKRIAVELNGDIVPKADFDSTLLHEDASLEVVCFVGGG